MSFEEEFDKIVRRKAEEEFYPFDQNNWDKASNLLDAERKVSAVYKMKRFYLPLAITTMIVIGGFVAYNLVTTTEDNAGLAVVSNKKQLNKKSERKEITDKESAQKYARSASEAAQLKPAAVSASPSLNVNTATPEIKPETTVLKRNSNKEINSGTGEIKYSSDKLATFGNSQNGSEKVNGDNGISETKKNESGQSPNTSYTNTTFTDEHVFEENKVAQEPITASLPPAETIRVNEEVANAGVETLHAKHSFIPFVSNETGLMNSPFVFLSRYEDDYYKTGHTGKHYLNVEAGASYLLGWQSNNGKDGQGLNWYGGFNYGRYLSKKVNVSLGIQAYTIGNIKQPFYQISEKEYGFGSRVIYTKVTTTQLYYVAVPVKVNYALNPTSEIGLGFNAAYLTNAKSTISKYYILDGEQKSLNEGSDKTNDIYKGTNTVNVMLSAHYKTALTKRVALNLEFNYGITDIFSNMGDIRTKESPMGIRLGVNYTLFDK